MAAEDEVCTVLYLGNEIVPVKAHHGGLSLRELRREDECPVIDALPDHLGAEPVGDPLESSGIGHGEKRVVVRPVVDALTDALPLHEVVGVEVPGGLEGEKRCDPHHHRAQDFIEDIEVVVGEAAPCLSQDAVVRIVGFELWLPRTGRWFPVPCS